MKTSRGPAGQSRDENRGMAIGTPIVEPARSAVKAFREGCRAG